MASTIPPDLTFTKSLKSIPIRRLGSRQNSDTNQYAANSRIQLTMPNSFCDLRGSYLTFFAQATANIGVPGTYLRFSYPIQSMFSRLQVLLGTTVIEDTDQFDLLHGVYKQASSYNSVTNVPYEGIYSPAASRAAETIAGRMYTVRLRAESLERVWPLHKLKLPLVIRLYVQDPSVFMEYDGGVPTVVINSVYLNFNTIEPDNALNALVDASISSGNLKVNFHSWENYNTSVSTATSNVILLPFKKKCVNAIIACYRDAADVNGPTVNGKYTDQFQAKGLQQAYCKVASTIFPQDKYDLAYTSGYQLLANPFNQIMNDDFQAFARQQDTFSLQDIANRTVVPFDLRHDNSPSAHKIYNNGIDTSATANAQSAGFNYNALTGNLSYSFFCKYEVICTILPDGNVSVDY